MLIVDKRCPQLQVLAIHDYNVDPSYIGSKVDSVKPKALASGQRLLYEEFGATGSNKQSLIQAATDVLAKVRRAHARKVAFEPDADVFAPRLGSRGCTGR